MKSDVVLHLVRRGLAAGALVLLGVTWRLWTPQAVFPQIPLLAVFVDAPAWFDWVAMSLMLAGQLVAGIARSEYVAWRFGLLVFAAALGVSVLADQHRLQPWTYQYFVVALIVAVLPPDRALLWLRILTVSIYFHSAVSKLDASFLSTHGEKLVEALLGIAGVEFRAWPVAARRVVVAMLPLGELLTAAALCTRRFRVAGLCGAVAMHGLLLLAVGPWGLNHKPAVLLWNALFIVQDVLLFRRFEPLSETRAAFEKRADTDSADSKPVKSLRMSIPQRIVTAMAFAVVVLPLLEPFDLFDHWPAWGLYASRPEQIKVYVHESQRHRLQETIGNYVALSPPDDPHCRVYIDRWSLDALDAPVYPQGRFQLGVALALARRFPSSTDVRVTIQSAANRWTGIRSERFLSGETEIEAELRRCWLNGFPKRVVTD